MCGISGQFRISGGAVDRGILERMSHAIVHRGPDDEGFLVEPGIGLAHRRLSIIDVSERSRQPMASFDDRLVIVFNGEVYNYAELIPDLEAAGARFRTTSDTEVVVNAIRIWGLDAAVKKFIGMFAFAVWDREDRSLSLVRDRVGIKPLFYRATADGVIFGSEVRALLAHPDVAREMDPVGLGQFLTTGYTLGARTAVKGVARLLPGHIARFTEDRAAEFRRYWDLDHLTHASSMGGRSLDDCADELFELLKSAFGYRLVSDVPVVNFLSGGVDSSLVAAILTKSLGADLEHISIGFEATAFDEVPRAKQVVEALGLTHTVRYLGMDEAQAGISRFVEVYDEPFGDTSGIPTTLLCGVAREGAKVALSADGGDEQFCGYESYARYGQAWSRLRHLPAGLRRIAAVGAGLLPVEAIAGAAARLSGGKLRPQLRARLQKALDILQVPSEGALLRTTFEKAWTWSDAAALVGVEEAHLYDGSVLSDEGLLGREPSFTGRMMRADYRAFLRDDILTKVDRASMHVSLEARDPFLDHRIAEFAFRLPLEASWGSDGSGGVEHKRILRHLLRRWVPDEAVSAPKRGFSIPLYSWMRNEWKDTVHEVLLDPSVARSGLIPQGVIERELQSFYGAPGGRAERIWMLLNLHMWWNRWMA